MTSTTYSFTFINIPDEWGVYGGTSVGRQVEAPLGPKVTWVSQAAGNITLPSTATVSSVVGNYHIGAFDFSGGALDEDSVATFIARSSGVEGTGIEYGPLPFNTFGTNVPITLNAPGGAWSVTKITNLMLGCSATATGQVAPARIIWDITSPNLSATITFVQASPVATTVAASDITSNSVTFNGTFNASGAVATWPVTYGFNFGLTTAYGTNYTVGTLTGTSNTNGSYSISGLTSNTTYHFRATASNTDVTNRGSDMSFTTLGGDSAVMNF